jgi:hypothetical protein
MSSYSYDIQSLENQNQAALQEALQDYQNAANNGVPNMQSKIAAAQQALQSYGANPTAQPPTISNPLTSSSTSDGISAGLGALGSIPGVGSTGIASAAQAATTASTNPSTVSSFLQQLFGVATGGQLSSSTYLVRGAAIIGGFILIAGAVFGFRELTTTVVEGGKKVAETGAAVAA